MMAVCRRVYFGLFAPLSNYCVPFFQFSAVGNLRNCFYLWLKFHALSIMLYTSLQVLAITEDLHDVHTLGKEAAVLHHSLMEDLSKVFHVY